MTKFKTKLTTAEVVETLRATPPVVPTPEQLDVLRFGELNTFRALLAKLPGCIALYAARVLLLESTSRNNRIEALLELAPRMEEVAFFTLLGEEWCNCVHIFEFKERLRPMIGMRPCPIRALMTEAENAAYDRLPERVTCYRGAAPERLDGICWSMSRDVANGFPFTYRYDQSDTPKLATGFVAKADIIAVKLGRTEEEIVSFSVREGTTQPADLSQAEEFFTRAERGQELQRKMDTIGSYLPLVRDLWTSQVLGLCLLRALIEGAGFLAYTLCNMHHNDEVAEQLSEIDDSLDELDLEGLLDSTDLESILNLCRRQDRVGEFATHD